MRSKALSLQVTEAMASFLPRSEEKCKEEPLVRDAPKPFSPRGPDCSVRSLLLDDDDELDLLITSLRPRTLDLDQNLNFFDEEMLSQGKPFPEVFCGLVDSCDLKQA